MGRSGTGFSGNSWPVVVVTLAVMQALGCGAEVDVNGFAAKVVVRDKAVMSHIENFDIGVLYGTDEKGNPVTCADFPDTYRSVRHDALRVAATRTMTWHGTESSLTEEVRVRAEQSYLVVVEGQAQYNETHHVVARGCEPVRVVRDVKTPVEVDVLATAGKPCSTSAHCEHTLGDCLSSAGFPSQGYCARVGCSAEDACPPGAACVQLGQGTVCAAVCEQSEDCETRYAVECVAGLGLGGCHKVCLKKSAPRKQCS